MSYSPSHNRSAAASSETILIVMGVAVALLLVVTFFGRRVAGLFGAGAKGLDGQTVAAGGGSGSNAGGVDGFLPGNTPAGTSDGTTDNSKVGATAGSLSSGKAIKFDPKFTPKEKETVLKAILDLTSGLDDLAPVEVKRTKAQNGSENSSKRILIVGPFTLDPDAKGGVNDFFQRTAGVNPGFSPERVIFHETVHAFHFANETTIEALFQADATKPSFESVSEAALKSQAVADARLGVAAIEDEVASRAKEKGLKGKDKDGNLIPAVADKIFADDPSLKADLLQAQVDLSKAVNDAGFPSRFPGDTHALDNTREFFAIVVEIAKFDPGRFKDLKNNPNFPFPDVLQFIQDHPELLR